MHDIRYIDQHSCPAFHRNDGDQVIHKYLSSRLIQQQSEQYMVHIRILVEQVEDVSIFTAIT